MPIYEYACEKCDAEFEVEQRITDDPLKTCPRCRSRKVKRLISQTSFLLKGGGWHADLYASGGKKKADEAGAGDGAESSAASDSGTSDSKAAPADKDKGKGKDKGSGKKKGAKAAA